MAVMNHLSLFSLVPVSRDHRLLHCTQNRLKNLFKFIGNFCSFSNSFSAGLKHDELGLNDGYPSQPETPEDAGLMLDQ